MQSLTWYMNRLRSMSPAEIGWRAQGAVRDAADRWRFPLGLYPTRPKGGTPEDAAAVRPFRLTDVPVAQGAQPVSGLERAAFDRLVERADRAAAHRLSFFNLDDVDLGSPIRWNHDHEHDRPAPTGFAPAIDYRDFRVTGDCKVVWEPNRHHHLVVLARAYRATGDPRYAQEVVDQITSWLDQCPFGTGMNWRSGLELGVRSINWVWAIDFILESELFAGDFRERVLDALFLHAWEIDRKYSRGSSANNHLIGEAAGVFITSTYFPELPRSDEWRRRSRAILLEEIHAQTFESGLNREHAFGYHFFVLQFYLFAGIAARRSGDDFPAGYWARLESMFDAAATLTAAGPAPMFGDADDGYVLDLGAAPTDTPAWLSVAAALFGRADFKRAACGFREPAFWLLGEDGCRTISALPPSAPGALRSHAFTDAGYYLLQGGGPKKESQISVFFDCAELGYGSIAAHGHADALSFTLRAFGQDVLVDPGTYDYFTYPAWRTYLRGTSAHNTVTVDHLDQSVLQGSFMWGSRARARCLAWSPDDNGGSVIGEHDGYSRLADPVVHRRRLTLDHRHGLVTVEDALELQDGHHVCLHFHFAEACRVELLPSNRLAIFVGARRLEMQLDARLRVELVDGEQVTDADRPGGGWVSRGYHRKSPSISIAASTFVSQPSTFVTAIQVLGEEAGR